MRPLFPERIVRPTPNGSGYEQLEQRYREVLCRGREIRIDAGKRAEYDVPAGQQAIVYVMEGSVRFEGDDTQAGPGEVVYFRIAQEPESKVGLEADLPFRGTLVIGAPAIH